MQTSIKNQIRSAIANANEKKLLRLLRKNKYPKLSEVRQVIAKYKLALDVTLLLPFEKRASFWQNLKSFDFEYDSEIFRDILNWTNN